MCNKSKLGDECYVGNISIYIEGILETSTYLCKGHCPTKPQESYVATKNNRERMSKWFHIHLTNPLKTLQHTDITM